MQKYEYVKYNIFTPKLYKNDNAIRTVIIRIMWCNFHQVNMSDIEPIWKQEMNQAMNA